ncbi:hypothetical protein B9Z55_028580 [Caenorhabditis nigoni]|uniref:Uncharacterized protein n=1 Tax=Caenorhabditis nigoni TaxID=1611254 RepID=A0A2G5SB09_9PELO|nr:hypothetical protein B9Z55_028580 [Caenorhabditis nigoni]
MTSKSSEASESDQKIVKQTLAWLVDAVEQISDDVQQSPGDLNLSTDPDSDTESESASSELKSESDPEHDDDCKIVYVKKEAMEAFENFEIVKEVVDSLLAKVEASENSVHVENESESFEESAEDTLLQVSKIFPASKNARALQESSSISNKMKVPKRRFVLSESEDSDDEQPRILENSTFSKRNLPKRRFVLTESEDSDSEQSQLRRRVVTDSEDSDEEQPRILKNVQRAQRIQGIAPMEEPDAPNEIEQISALAAILDAPIVPQANPPNMTMQRHANIYDWCIRIGRKIESDNSN